MGLALPIMHMFLISVTDDITSDFISWFSFIEKWAAFEIIDMMMLR